MSDRKSLGPHGPLNLVLYLSLATTLSVIGLQEVRVVITREVVLR